MEYLMGIDLGSTSLKAVVYDLKGNFVASGSRPTLKNHPDPKQPDWTVWMPDYIWNATAEAIQEAVSKLDNPNSIKAVAVTGMGMDGVPIDEKGQWLYPFISWHDPRTKPQLEWWKEKIGSDKTFSIGGNPVLHINSALRILWMKENEPEIYKRTKKWLLIEDFLNFMLCGKYATDPSMASCTLLFDQKKLNWSKELIDLSGIEGSFLSDVQASGTYLGEVNSEVANKTGLAEGTPVIMGGHDHLCGALPVGAFKPGVTLNVCGTWEMVSITTEQPALVPELLKMGLTVQAHVAPEMYSTWGGAVSAEMLEWYRNLYKEESSKDETIAWDELMRIASTSPPGANNTLFLPHLSGSACPVIDDASKGAFLGLTIKTSRADMIRSIVEALSFQFKDLVTIAEKGLGEKLNKFIAIGGVTRNKFLMQNKADIIGCPVEVANVEEASPLGAAMLAGIGIGKYKEINDAYEHVSKPGTIYEPNLELSNRYNELFAVYQGLYDALKPINHQL
jgi:xylulokinase